MHYLQTCAFPGNPFILFFCIILFPAIVGISGIAAFDSPATLQIQRGYV